MTFALVAMLLAAPPPDGEPPNPYLLQARELFEQLDFERCLVRLRQAFQWKSNTQDLRDIEVYGGLCSLNLGQRSEAEEHFKLALKLDPNCTLPELVTPKAVKLFTYLKRAARGPVPPMPDEDLPGDDDVPKGERRIEVTTPSRLPVKPLPLVLGGASLVGLIAGVSLGAWSKGLESQARAQAFESDYLALRGQAFGGATAANVVFVLAGLLAAAAVAVLLSGL
jgi:tetratricopeptide (TPR) repeat protein